MELLSFFGLLSRDFVMETECCFQEMLKIVHTHIIKSAPDNQQFAQTKHAGLVSG